MSYRFGLSPLALAAVAAIGTVAAAPAQAAAPTPGKYVAGDFHNHTTCSDGSISLQKLVKKSTEKTGDGNFGLDWFVQSGHGGNGSRNCTLVEDETLSTPAYPYVPGMGPTTTWENSGVTVKGDVSGTTPNRNMWRWQSVQEFSYPVLEYLSASKNTPLFLGIEQNAPGHEHVSSSVIAGQMPKSIDTATLPTTPGYTPLGNANALAQWEYCFDRSDTDTSRGANNNWNCSVTGSLNAADPSWNATAQKLMPASGTGTGNLGHAKTLESLKWMQEKAAGQAYYVPAHLERAGPFNPNGNNGYNIEHLRNFNNTAPEIAFGFETQPGHGASNARGEYTVLRNTIDGVRVDSVGGTTYGGTGVYGATIGGVWDALLGEGRNWWFFASSDWHNRGSFGPDDRRSSQDFLPGEYQRDYIMVRNGSDKLRPQAIVDGMRTGNSFTTSGQLIDRFSMVACASNASHPFSLKQVRDIAMQGAQDATDTSKKYCATMGQKLKAEAGDDIVVGIALRDPQGVNNSPYSFNNPSLLQVGVRQPINKPQLDHVDLIGGLVTGYKTPGTADYSGEWPRNTAWLSTDGVTAGLDAVPAAAKNTSAKILQTFSHDTDSWKKDTGADGSKYWKMAYTVPAVSASQYVRVRGTNLPASVPYETDANGNPLADLFTNAADTTKLKIACTTVGKNVPATGDNFTSGTIDGCPSHLPVVNGQKMVAYDVAAWSDLWFYSNPIYIQVKGSVKVAGVK